MTSDSGKGDKTSMSVLQEAIGRISVKAGDATAALVPDDDIETPQLFSETGTGEEWEEWYGEGGWT